MNSKKLWSVVIILSMLGAALTVLAKPLANWETPENLSDWQSTIYETRLEIAPDGTLGAFWVAEKNAGGKYGLFAHFREPGQPWNPPEPISGWFDPLSIAAPTYWGAGMAPDGTAWVMWSAIDSTIPADNQFVYAAHKPPGGAWQTDTLHGPITKISDAKMAMSPDGDLVVAWIETAGPGNFILNERHRFAGAPIWEPHVRIDDAAPGTDIVLTEERMASSRAFANKIWNAARFLFLKMEYSGVEPSIPGSHSALAEAPLEDRWMFSRLNRCAEQVNRSIAQYRYHEAAHTLWHFFWHEFCDWYVEIKKLRFTENSGLTSDWRNILTVFERF